MLAYPINDFYSHLLPALIKIIIFLKI